MAYEPPHLADYRSRREPDHYHDGGSGPDMRFKTFGVLPETHQSKGSTFVSITLNVAVLLVLIVIGSQAKKIQQHVMLTRLEAPLPEMKKPDVPKPPPPPKIQQPKMPPPPQVAKIELPKIEVPEPPKIQTPVMKAQPIAINTPAPPKVVTPPPAPVRIASLQPQAASIANNNPHPAAIRLGSQSNPINNTSGPAVSPINLGRSGAPGMPASNSGMGPASKINLSGSGAPDGRMGGTANAPHAIAGLNNGVPGGTGPMNSRMVGAVQIAQAQPQAIRPMAQATPTAAKAPPKVLFKPRPEYTAEAKQLHLEGVVYVKIHVTASGTVQVVGIQGSGLGHGLNEAAIAAVRGMRFSPAMQDGHPADWDGIVNIAFQIAG